MPLFGLLPYDEEENRRRALTPSINPNLPDLPPMPAPKPRPRILSIPGGMPGAPPESPLPETVMPDMPLPTRGKPGVLPGPPSDMEQSQPPSRYTQVQAEREGYLRGTPGRGKSSLRGALRGFARGLGSGQGLGGGLGGAISGAIYGAADPRGLREAEFEERELPKLYDRFAFEDRDRAAEAAARKAAGEQALNRIQMANTQSQIDSRAFSDELARSKEEREANAPLVLNPGQAAIDKRTGKELYKSPALPKPQTEAELTIEPSSGKSFEQIAEESYQGRGGDGYVLSKLPVRTQQLINGEIKNANPTEIQAAQRAFQDAITQERKAILDYTRGDVRGRAMGARKGGTEAKPIQRKGQPGRRAISVAEAAELLK